MILKGIWPTFTSLPFRNGPQPDLRSTTTTAPLADRLAPAFVWFVWVAMSVLAFRFVKKFGVSLPFDDDWIFIKILSGQETLSWNFLWAQHNEHRIPLPKILYLLSLRLSGFDFRAPMFVSVMALSLGAVALLLTAKTIRGRLWWSDAILPVIMLQAGHADNLIWAFQTPFTIGTALVCCLIYFAASTDSTLTLVRLLRISFCVVALPLCGANGVVFTPAVALWLTWLGWLCLQERNPWAWGCWGLAIVAIAIALCYFLGYQRPLHHPPAGSMMQMGTALVQLLAISLGLAVNSRSGPWPDLWFPAGLTLLGSLCTLGLLFARLVLKGDRRALGFCCISAGCVCLLLAMAYGRSASTSDAGLVPRYVTLGTPLLASIYLAWSWSLRAEHARLLQVLFAGVVVLLYWPNWEQGTALAARRHTSVISAYSEVRHGVPAPFAIDRVLAVAAFPAWIPESRRDLEKMVHVQIGVFGKMRPKATLAEEEVPVLLKQRGGRLKGSHFFADRHDSELEVVLPQSRKIKGIRWEYELRSKTGYRPEMGLTWTGGEHRRSIWHPLHCTATPTASHVWIDDQLDSLRLSFYSPGTEFVHRKLILLYEP